MKVFAYQLVFKLFLIVNIGISTDGLRCYQCSWSNNPKEFAIDRGSAADKGGVRSGNPVALPYIGGKVARPPNRTELHALCDHVTCSDTHTSCLIWSFVSSSPINKTYMCVRSSKQQTGCYRQEIQIKDVKKHLTLEACLCNNADFCNQAMSFATYQTSVIVIMSCVVYMLIILYFP